MAPTSLGKQPCSGPKLEGLALVLQRSLTFIPFSFLLGLGRHWQGHPNPEVWGATTLVPISQPEPYVSQFSLRQPHSLQAPRGGTSTLLPS